MATEDKTKEVTEAHIPDGQMETTPGKRNTRSVKVTEEYTPDGQLTKKTKEYPPKKTISDWVAWCAQVLAVGTVVVSIFALVIGAYQFKTQQSDNAQMQATQVAATQAQTLDQQRQATLVGYLDDMSNLLLMSGLQTAKPGSTVQALAEARTLTALRNLDGLRKGTLIRFLWEANLIKIGANMLPPIISLNGANLSETIFTGGSLNLGGSVSSPPIVALNSQTGQLFSTGANLQDVDLSGAILEGADLRYANLQDANLSFADLENANLKSANLKNTNLNSADLKGATMPDGSKHP